MTTNSVCSSFALQSFPVKTLVHPTLDLYFSVLEPLSFEFQWNTRTTPPTFLEPDSVREEIALARKEGQYA